MNRKINVVAQFSQASDGDATLLDQQSGEMAKELGSEKAGQRREMCETETRKLW